MMATQNDYNLMWMNSNEMMVGDGVGGVNASVPSDIMTLDQTPAMESSYFSMPPPPPYESVTQQPLELDGFLMMEDLEGDYCDEPPRYMAAATQTIPSLRRKIMPIKHPGLKLQTPIAFKGDTDPNVIPIQKHGMAICVKCGAIGVKHAFYTRNRNYCSLACARGLPEEGQSVKENRDENDAQCDSTYSQFKLPNNIEIKDEELLTKEVLNLPSVGDTFPSFNLGPHMASFPVANLDLTEDPVPEPVYGTKIKQELSLSYDWKPNFSSPEFVAAPVNNFKHAPMSDAWDDIAVGMKVEVENSDLDIETCGTDSFWVATVIRIGGYKALLRYEGYDDVRDFWVNLCNSNVHPVGWCAMRGKPLIPPKSIAENCRDWKDFLVRRLTGARTLPTSFSQKVTESLRSRFRLGMQVEVIDRERICQMYVATIKRIVGKRLHLAYFDALPVDSGFWCHEDSPLIHPVGWSLRVGHSIEATDTYVERCESGVMEKDDASEELFTAPFQSVTDWKTPASFHKGMKLEAIDPLNLSAICAATVMKVMRDGYLMIRIDSYSEDGDGSDWFCYHSASPCIFPPGFCHENNIPLVPPINHSPETFTWDKLHRLTGCVLAPTSLFHREELDHGMVVGMSLECADIMDPRLVCVATVTRVVGRLLKIHFDGWEDDFDQWMDCTSPDIYPVGWCNLVSHKLEAPKHQLKPCETAEKKKKFTKKTKRKTSKMKGPANKKQLQMAAEENVAYAKANNGEMLPAELTPVERFSSVTSLLADPSIVDNQVSESCDSRLLDSTSTAIKEEQPIATPDSPASPLLTCHYIPRLADGVKDGDLNPSEWACHDVATFLRVNDCGVYADNFLTKGTTGLELLKMSSDEIMKITGKIGPALKISDLIKQLHTQMVKAKKWVRR